MSYRISYCVVFITIMWGAFAANEEKISEIFQSNMTRNDFSKLLNSLIKLNEQRVNVLQKLYRLEDYGILSEVLRSGGTRTRNGNSNNLFLVVLSKNQSISSRRNMDVQVVDSVPALDSRPVVQNPEIRFKNNPEQTHSLKPTNVMYKPIEADNFDSNADKKKKRFEIDDGSHRFTTSANDRDEDVDNNSKMKLEFKYQKPDHEKVDYDSNNSELSSAEGNPNINMESKYYKSVKGKLKEEDERNKYTNASAESLENDDHNEKYQHIKTGYNNKPHKIAIDVSYENDHNPTYHKAKKHISDKNYHNNKYSTLTKHISNEQDEDRYHTVYKGLSYENDHNNKDRKKTRDMSKESVDSKKKHQITRNDSITHDNKEKDNSKKYSNIPIEKFNENIHSNKRLKNVSDEYDHKHKFSNSLSEESDGDIQTSKHPRDLSNKNNYSNKTRGKSNENYQKYSNIQSKKSNENVHLSIYPGDHSGSNHFSHKYSNVAADNSDARDEANKYHKTLADTLNENNQNNKYSYTAGPNSKENDSKDTKIDKDNKNFDNDNANKKINIGRERSNEDDSSHRLANIKKIEMKMENAHYKKYPKIGIKNPIETPSEDISNEDIKIDKENENEFDNDDLFSMEIDADDTRQINSGVENSQESKIDFLKSNPENIPVVDPESRKNFQKCLNKKAGKLCTKSCISAYKNVCRRLKCTSRSKRALKKECKRSCKNSFTSSKYSSEY